MKLCFIGDGRSIHVLRWVTWFAARHEVLLLSTAQDCQPVEFRVLTLPSSTSFPGTRLVASVREVRHVLHQERPDVVHAHYINEAGWFAAAARWRPLVITAWGSDLYRAREESRLARRLNPWALRSADWVTCDSRDQARVVRTWGVSPDRVSVINWGVDTAEFHPGVDGRRLRSQLEIPAEAPVVLSPREWLPNSNIEAIVEAHARLPQDVYLLLRRIPRFEGERAGRVEAGVAASPARERIRVLGEVAAGELPAIYAAADAVVSLCTTDGTSVSVLEAMALGRPVVALRNASMSEWLSEPGGRMVERPAPEPVAEAIGGFLADRALRARAAAHNIAIVEGRASRATEMARMEEVYARLVPRGPRHGPPEVAR